MSGCHSESLCQFLLLLISPWRCPLLPKTANSEYYELFLTSQWWWCLVTKSCLTCDPMDCSLPCSTLSMGFPRREHWSGLPFPSPGDLPKTGIEPRLLALQADSLPTEPPVKPQLHNSEKQSGLFCGSLILLRTTAEIKQVNHNGHNLKMVLVWKPNHGRTVGQTMEYKGVFHIF